MTRIKELWYEYLVTEALTMTDKEREIIPRLTEADEELRKGLSKEQVKLLDLCNNYLDEIATANTEQAFLHGVRFTAGFLFEALGK